MASTPGDGPLPPLFLGNPWLRQRQEAANCPPQRQAPPPALDKLTRESRLLFEKVDEFHKEDAEREEEGSDVEEEEEGEDEADPTAATYIGNPFLRKPLHVGNPWRRGMIEDLREAAQGDEGGGGGGGGGGASEAQLGAFKAANDAEHAAMKEFMDSLNKRLEELKASNDKLKASNDELQGKNEELLQSNNLVVGMSREKKKAADNFAKQLEAAQREMEVLRARYDKEVAKIKEGSATYEQLVYGEYKAKLAELDGDLRKILGQHKKKNEQEHVAMEARIATFEAQATALETKVETLIAEIQEARQQDEDDATAKVEALAEKIAEKAREDLSETRRQLKLLRSSVQALEENSAKLARQRIERLEERLEEISPSRDVKVAPGRSVRI